MSSGLTTLLFTDIEASTRLWEQDGERMSRALAQHDALSRAAVERHNGVVVKMTGDGMYAAFGDPVDAINATVALQQALKDPSATSGLELRLRYGLHLGVVERRDQDLFGSPVNRAARIMKAAHGGQILLSQAVVDYAREKLPGSVSLRDLGAVRLRDLASSEHVYQLLHPELRQEFPALRSLEATPNNLPQQVTSFVGRERELAEAKAMLEGTRLLTLLGMGGLGKTRLSLQIGADVLEKFPDGVWFVDLAPIKDSSLVPNAAAQALSVHEEPGKSLTQTLYAHVKERKLLLILDNCEHLVAACASLADQMLAHASQVRIVATSREALRIRGEQTYPVLPLAVPGRNADAESLLRSDAVQLFVERARLQKPTFEVTEREAPAVAELCARLEGIPLALELAAARLRSLSVQDINKRLNDRFKLLTGGSRVALERQQTLRALVSWSYDLLNEQEQIVLDRLSVFVGGFDLDAAEAVCGADPIAPEDVLDLVTSLVEKSLIMVKQEEGWSRYGMLETIREFAREHLIELGDEKGRYGLQQTVRDFAREKLIGREDLAATAARHCSHYHGFAKKAREELHGPDQADWMRRVEADLDNLRAATTFALAGGVDPVIAVKIEVALMRFRTLGGYSSEGRNNIRAALALPSVSEPNIARAHALYVGAVLAMNQGDHAEATQMLTESLAIRRTLGNQREIAATLSTLSTACVNRDEAEKARECEEEALLIFRKLGDRMGEVIGLINLGEIAGRQGDDAAARGFFSQGLAIAKSIKHQELEADSERNLGDVALRGGDLKAAASCFERSLKICRDTNDKRGAALALWRLGKALAARGDHDSARAKMSEALPAFQSFGMNSEALDCLEDHAELLQAIGRAEDAVRLHAAAAAAREALALQTPRGEAARQKTLDDARGILGSETFDAAWSLGRTWPLDKAIDECLGAVGRSAVPA
ncbi:MAG TPA: tetratricopeptide repeat protein [Casimicrobiaceae bacterium]|nr:tetratricopeptide repeat protein [Casimicrobiaceae bacterium]